MLHLGSLRSDAAQRRTVKADASSVADWARRFEALGATAVDERLRAFYAQGLPAGDTVLADVPLLAMDFETTGLDPQQDEIVSIGIVPMTLARIQSSASRHWIVRPRGVLNAESVTFHAEATDDPLSVARDIRAAGSKAGLSIKPGTPLTHRSMS